MPDQDNVIRLTVDSSGARTDLAQFEATTTEAGTDMTRSELRQKTTAASVKRPKPKPKTKQF